MSVPETLSEQILTSYLPGFVVRMAAEGMDAPRATMARAQGAVLLLDLVGFVALTDRLTGQGRRRAEAVSNLLDTYFGGVTDCILAHGGDIITFAGDGVIAAWSRSLDLEEDARLAAQCAIELQNSLGSLQRRMGVALRQRIVIGAGEILLCTVGGVANRWFALAAGDALDEAVRFYHLAGNGDILLCPTTRQALAGCSDIDVRSGSFLAQIHHPLPLPPPSVALPHLTTTSLLMPFVAPSVVERVRAGYGAWLGEFRSVTTLFLGVAGLECADDLLATLQSATEIVQSELVRFDGSLDRVSIDEKGLGYLITFGVPSKAHEDDATRALRAALALCDRLRAIGLVPSSGVATGELFCGRYGGSRRQTYSVVGDAVNIAARLRQEVDDDILCDEATRTLAKTRIAFADLGEIAVRGKTDTVRVHRPLRESIERPARSESELLGRTAERAALHALIADRASGGPIIVEGEAGIGKSRLLAEIADIAGEYGVSVIAAAGAQIEGATPYFPWRDALRGLFGDAEGEALRAVILATLADDEKLRVWAPLLNDVLPTGIAEDDLTREITGGARSALTQRLVVHLFGRKCQERPFVLILDDVHWFDDASVALLRQLVQAASGPTVVVASRPLAESASAALASVFGDKAGTRIALGALARGAVERLVESKLGVKSAPATLYDFVFRRAAGHPLYTEQLVLGLRAAGCVAIDGASCRLATDSLENLELAIPNTLQGVIVSRVDRLGPSEQLVLKVASVTGFRFSAEMLAEVIPVPQSVATLNKMIERLVADDFILRADAGGSAETYSFKHVLVQQAIYDLLLFEQRQLLHRRIADWLEDNAPGGREAACAQLALHWERAGDAENAVRYLEIAADLALRRYSVREAIAHCSKAIALSEQQRLALPATRRARLSAILGDAYHELFDYKKAARRFEEALTLLSRPIPGSRIGLVQRTAQQAAAQLGRRLGLASVSLGARATREREAAHIYERLAEIAYFDSRNLELLHYTLASLNHAEASNSTREVVDGYAALSIGLSAAGLRRLAAFYNRRSIALAEAKGAISDIAYAELVNMVFAASQGLWDMVEASAARASPLFLRLGAVTRWQQVQATLCFARLTRCDFAGAAPLIAELKRSLETSDTPAQVRVWILGAEMIVETAHGRGATALARTASEMAVDPTIHRADRLLCHGLAALVHLRCGDVALAAATADLALANLAESPPSAWHITYALVGVAESYLEALARQTDGRMKPKALVACGALRRYARRIPVAAPSACLLRSRYEALAGHTKQAQRWRRRALATAQCYRIGLSI